ncbi:MAG: CDP-alcohol phosphatidyltransferase family protein [Christensenellaceae bacterium]|jgi:CDP-diacylglycerol--glycerol-3-phosphate 3-phosphatidyltransferase|nr:CDP-alcohol phosphatidyltransferase family protein [Christensenellaceae bacterium]
MLDTHARKWFDRYFLALARFFLRIGLLPNHVTALAFLIGIGSGAALYYKLTWLAVGLLWLSGLLDAVDGQMARLSGKSSMLGAQFDIVSDRVVELGIVWALALRRADCLMPLLGLVSAILISITVFLTTGMLSRPSGKKSFYYQAGLMERTEGFIAFTAMMLFPGWLALLTWAYAALIGFTIVQRLAESIRLLKQDSIQ